MCIYICLYVYVYVYVYVYYIILYCVILHYIILYCVLLYCIMWCCIYDMNICICFMLGYSSSGLAKICLIQPSRSQGWEPPRNRQKTYANIWSWKPLHHHKSIAHPSYRNHIKSGWSRSIWVIFLQGLEAIGAEKWRCYDDCWYCLKIVKIIASLGQTTQTAKIDPNGFHEPHDTDGQNWSQWLLQAERHKRPKLISTASASQTTQDPTGYCIYVVYMLYMVNIVYMVYMVYRYIYIYIYYIYGR
jgi:hypothetical protein